MELRSLLSDALIVASRADVKLRSRDSPLLRLSLMAPPSFFYILAFDGLVLSLRFRLWWKTSTGSSSWYSLGRRTRTYSGGKKRKKKLTPRLMHEADCIVS